MKKLIILMIICSGSLLAQNLSGETEAGTDGKGEGFFSQYLFYDLKSSNVLVRYFYVNGILQRGEFAVGPTLKLNNASILKLQFGGTTDQQIMVAGTLIIKIGEREIVHIADGKLATQDGPSGLYQKLFIPIIKSGKWQFRVEDLQIGDSQSFLRLGIEYQQKFPDKKQIFLAPFYDPIRNTVGGQIGVRFF